MRPGPELRRSRGDRALALPRGAPFRPPAANRRSPDTPGCAPPIALGSRFAETPALEGWAGADVDVRFADDTPIPEVAGHLEGKNIVFGKFHLLEGLDVDVTEANNKVSIPKARIDIAAGIANLNDVVIDVKAMRLVHAAVDCHDVSFSALMRELGNSQHPHVEWDLRDVRSADISGPLVPMKLDGEIVAKTDNFIVYDNPVDGSLAPPRHRRDLGAGEHAPSHHRRGAAIPGHPRGHAAQRARRDDGEPRL